MNRTPARRGWAIGAVVAVLVVAVVIAVAASGGNDSSGDSGGTSSAKQETAKVEVEGTPLTPYQADVADKAVGTQAPTLIGETFDGTAVRIEPTGRPQVVMFLAHWCPHCQAEVPRVVTLAKHRAFDGLDVASVATGTSSELPNYPPSAWLEREHWPFTVLLDDEQSTAAQAYGLSAYPFFVFLDGNGTVLGRTTGEVEPKLLEQILDAMRTGKPLPSTASSASSSSSSSG